jgi:hypothetical protein
MNQNLPMLPFRRLQRHCRIDLTVVKHLINPCGMPGWTGTEMSYHMNAYTTVSDSNISHTAVATLYPYVLFNKSPVQLRLIGARGGRAYGRNQRARRALMSPPTEAAPLLTAPRQTTAEAVALLDAQFPWLRGAEQRRGISSLRAGCKRTDRTTRRRH